MSYQEKHYSADDVRRLQELVKEGVIVKQEVKALSDGLSETVKAIADEMEIPASQLKKVITVAFKNSRDDETEKFAELEDLLDSIGIK